MNLFPIKSQTNFISYFQPGVPAALNYDLPDIAINVNNYGIAKLLDNANSASYICFLQEIQ